MKTFYLWGRSLLRKVELFDGREDLEKKTPIPESSSVIQRLKDATEKAHTKRRNILNRFKRKL